MSEQPAPAKHAMESPHPDRAIEDRDGEHPIPGADSSIRSPSSSSMSPPVASLRVEGEVQPAQRIGRYAVLRQLGQGAMGVVLAAYDEELDRRVALKLLLDRHPQATEHRFRILREAQAMARVSHPNVVHVYEVGEFQKPGSQEHHIFISMEFVDGMTLSEWQRQPGREWGDILSMYQAAGQGLLAAHQSGLVHRDFKPE